MVNIAKADGFTALHLAAVNDHGDIVEILAGQVNRLATLKYLCLNYGDRKGF